MECIEVRVTAGSHEEAERICTEAVSRRLAACAQVVAPITSTYRWQGEIERSEEWLLLLKTTAGRFEELARCVTELHSYEVPEIIAVPITHGSAAYLDWVRRETAPESAAE